MKQSITFITVIACITILTTTVGFAQIPQITKYQGVLKDGAGNKLNGNFSLTFTIHGSGGALLFTENHPSVPVTNGLFGVELGSVNVGGLNLPFDEAYELRIQVNGNLLAPGQAFTTSPYAHNSLAVRGPAATDNIFQATGSVGVGTTSPDSTLHVSSPDYPVTTFERTTNITNDDRATQRLLHSTTGNMIDGFGATSVYAVRDNANVVNELGALSYYRDGADNSGKFVVQTFNGGTLGDRLVVNAAGDVGIGSIAPTEKLEVSGGNIKIDAANKIDLGGAHITSDNASKLNLYVSGSKVVESINSRWHFFVPVVVSGGTNNKIIKPGGDNDRLIVQGAFSGKANGANFELVGENTQTDAGDLKFTYGGGTTGSNAQGNMETRFIRQFFGGSQNVLTLDNVGNVGVGITTPTEKFDVNGNIKVSGSYVDSSGDAGTLGQILSATATGTDWIDATTLTDGDWVVSGSTLYSDVAGNVGIGTSTPSEKLEVRGRIVSSEGIHVTDDNKGFFVGVPASKGFVLQQSSSPFNQGSSLGGLHLASQDSGTPGVLTINPSNTSDTSKWTIFNPAGNVGVGNPNPTEKLDIKGSIRVSGRYIDSSADSGTSGEILSSTGTGTDWIDASTLNDGDWTTNGNQMYSAVSGFVGIGKSNPEVKLDVIGDIQASGRIGIAGSTLQLSQASLSYGAVGLDKGRIDFFAGGQALGFFAINPDAATSHAHIFDVITAPTASGLFVVKNEGVAQFAIDKDGNVGIATTTPSQKLEVAGYIRTDDGANQSGIEVFRNGISYGDFTAVEGAASAIQIKARNDKDIRIYDDSDNGIVVKDGGNVGIGTPAPDSALHITDDTNIVLRTEYIGSAFQATLFTFTRDVYEANDEDWLTWREAGGGTPFAAIKSHVVDATAGSIDGQLRFATTLNDTQADRLTITEDGKVGIGLTDPVASLQIFESNSDTGASAPQLILDQNGSGDAALKFALNLQDWYFGADNSDADKLKIGRGSSWDSVPDFTIDTLGNIGVGNTDPQHPLHMASGAHVTAGGVWTNASSREYKENIEMVTADEALDAVRDLVPVKYTYKNDKNESYVGFIAEDVPELLATRDRKALSPMDIVAALTKVVQEQQKKIEELEVKINQM